MSTSSSAKTSKKLVAKIRRISKKKKQSIKKKSLPSFQFRGQPHTKSDGGSENIDEFEDLDDCGELPCDTLLAFQSLQENARGLHIPIGNNQQIQVLLESQIFHRFEEGHASTVLSELSDLIRNNQLMRLSCHDDGETTALVLTKDYINGVWNAHQTTTNELSDIAHPEVIVWFAESLNNWTESTISEDVLRDSWRNDSCKTQCMLSFDDALQSLLRLRVILRVPAPSTTSTDQFRLWLPKWGLVLKHWNEARKTLLGFIARSKGGEASEMNILKQNRHSSVTSKFLLDELTYTGRLQVIQKPFGRFFRRVD